MTQKAGKGVIVREVFMEETLEMNYEEFLGNSPNPEQVAYT